MYIANTSFMGKGLMTSALQIIFILTVAGGEKLEHILPRIGLCLICAMLKIMWKFKIKFIGFLSVQ